MTLVVTIEF